MKPDRITPKTTHRARPRGLPAEGRLQRLRLQLADGFATTEASVHRWVQLTLNEAEALARETAVPELVFPLLAEEKLAQLSRWQRRQARVRELSEQLSFAA